MANMLKIGNNWLPRTGPPMVNQDGSLGANFGYSSSQTYVKLMPAQELHPVHEPWSMDKIRKAHEVELQELA